MRRRRFLAAIGIGGLAGCTSEGTSSPTAGPVPPQYRPETTGTGGAAAGTTPTETAAPTETETATPTPTPDPPEVLEVAVVDEWEESGDIEDTLDGIRPGAYVSGATRFTIPVHDGRVLARVEARVLEGETLVDEGTTRVDAATDEAGRVEWEAAVDFATGPWDEATHTLEVQVTDTETGLTSDVATTAFEVLAAAGSGSF